MSRLGVVFFAQTPPKKITTRCQDAIRQKVLKLYRDPELRRRMGQAGRAARSLSP